MRYRISIVTLLCMLLTLGSSAQQIHEYTQEHPLVIVCDWEFPPYEFNNDKGQPDGYNIEVLDMILNRLKIPHRYLMQEWYQATESFEKREADLIHALSFNYDRHPYVITQNLIHFYRIVSARRPSTPPLKHFSELTASDTLIVKNNDYAPIQIQRFSKKYPFVTEYHSPRDALTGIYSGKYKYFLWGEHPVNWKIREFGLDSLVVDETDIPPGELRLIGYDKELIDLIDDEFARLEQAGEIEKIRDKWFHPEHVHNDSSPIAIFFIIGAIIIGLVGFLLSRLIRSRVLAAVNKSVDLNNMMSQAIGMGEYYVLEHDLTNDHIRNVYGNFLPAEGMTMKDFIRRMDKVNREDFETISTKLAHGDSKADIKYVWNAGTADHPDKRHLHGSSIVEYENGKPRFIVSSMKDVTKEINEEREISEMGEKYMKIFDTNLVAMSIYDPHGMLISMNQMMRELCNFNVISEEEQQFFRKLCLFDISLLRDDFDPESHEGFHVCQHMTYGEFGVDKYIEFRIRPVISEDDVITFYNITARDVTGERTMYLEQRHHDQEMHRIGDASKTYESQLQYLLEKSNMFVWHYDIKGDCVKFTRSLSHAEYSESLAEFCKGVPEAEREITYNYLHDCLKQGKPFNAIHHYEYTPEKKGDAWFAISGIPTFDKDGSLVEYFGIARNVTDLITAQHKLKEETARAEDSGRLKSVFLANMTHEIRTPLNAIVGFSDLLPVVDTVEERMEFIRIIRNNCDMLLRLINDILEASSMGQALAIEPEEVDFAQVFDDICQTLAQRVQEPGVEFIKENPYAHFHTVLDKGRVQQVLTNFVTNAVKYTHEGHIKVGYRQDQRAVKEGEEAKNGLYFYCEDTGTGIPKEKQASIFERFVKLNDFVQGTGLGLSICKSIAERCGGEIGVTSEGEGHGSTFWLWIPCEKIEGDRKS